MTTLMSSGCLSRACLKVLRFLTAGDQAGQPLPVGASEQVPALYQCRLLALTLPTMTMFFNTAAAATSAVRLRGDTAGPTPVRQTIPLAPIAWIESAITVPTPVHSTMTSGSKPISLPSPSDT